MELLLFRLYGPMASWGEIAVGETRHTAAYPGKSALLGLLGAALGIRRNEDAVHGRMASGYLFAVKMISSGHLLRDYHTTQVPDSAGKFSYGTRKDELYIGRSRLGTILSSREYRSDALCLVAVRARENAPFSLHALAQALSAPKFHLYLGRKSCPLAAPLNPTVGTFSGYGQAFADYHCGPIYISGTLKQRAEREAKDVDSAVPLMDQSPTLARFSRQDRLALSIGSEPVRYYWEGDAVDLTSQQELTRHDQPVSRSRWQFSRRREQLFIQVEEG